MPDVSLPPVGNPVREAIMRRIETGPRTDDPFPPGFVPREDDTPELTDAASRSVLAQMELDEAPTDLNPSYGLDTWDF